MSVTCTACRQTIEKKSELLVMMRFGLALHPFHETCWGKRIGGSGAGGIGYRGPPVNTSFFAVVAAIVFAVCVALILLIVLPAYFHNAGQMEQFGPEREYFDAFSGRTVVENFASNINTLLLVGAIFLIAGIWLPTQWYRCRAIQNRIGTD